jgi:adenosine/AMP kinase
MNPDLDQSEDQIKKNVEDRIREAILAIQPEAQVTVSVDMKTGKVVVEGADDELVNRAIDSIPSSDDEA